MVIYQKAVDIYHNGCDFILPEILGYCFGVGFAFWLQWLYARPRHTED